MLKENSALATRVQRVLDIYLTVAALWVPGLQSLLRWTCTISRGEDDRR